MSTNSLFYQLFFDYTLRNVAFGSAILGIVSGALGTFAVLRKQALLGDSISHAALPGVVLAFILTGSKAPIILLFGAATAGWIGTCFILSIIRNTKIKEDGALGIVLSVFFGFGLFLLTLVQKMPTAAQAGLDRFLFGQAATLMTADIIMMSVLGGVSLVGLLVLWKEFKIISFDPEFALSQGFPVRKIELLLTLIIVLAIVIGLQTVGVVLMSAMLVAPAASARQWTNRLGVMVFLSTVFGALGGVSGALISSMESRLPTGPIIVIILGAVALFSILFAPNRGVVWNYLRIKKNKRIFKVEHILLNLYFHARLHDPPLRPHAIETLTTMDENLTGVARGLEALKMKGFVRTDENGLWSLTEVGYRYADQKWR